MLIITLIETINCQTDNSEMMSETSDDRQNLDDIYYESDVILGKKGTISGCEEVAM